MRGVRSRMEVLKGKEEEEEFELSLELSLGRSYEKLDKSNPFEGQKNYGFSRFDKFESCKEDLGDENVCLTSDEGYKRLTGNKLVLGAHQFQAGVLDMNLSPWGHKNVLQAEARCKKIAVSDYQRGGTNDTGSNSSSLSSLQNLGASRKSGAYEHFEGHDSSSPTQIEPSTENSKQDALSDQTNNNCSTSGNPPTSKGTSSSGLIEPPKQRPELALFAHMPCVSTTGNGPNGRTINGFLYKYTKLEVSIVCVCHGSLFSPAEFVEHAGGVDILYPMRHITVVPSLSG